MNYAATVSRMGVYGLPMPACRGWHQTTPCCCGQKQQLSTDQRKRNEVEGCFGSGKRKYSLDLIMARLSKGADTLISMAFLVMRAEKIFRLLRLFFITVCAWFYVWQRVAPLQVV
jgi:hypothetical protein